MAEIGFFIDILLGFPGPSDGLRLHSIVFFSFGSGLTADSSVLTLTLAFLDFGLDFAQSFPFHAQFCSHTSDRAEGGLNLEELFVLCTNLSNKVLALETSKDAQTAVILQLKTRIKKLEKKWRKNAKLRPTKDDSAELDAELDEAINYMDIVEAVNVRQSNETEELNLDADTEVIAKDKGSGEKGGSTVSTARPDVGTARKEIGTADPITPPTTTTIFDDEVADTLSYTLKPLPTIDPKDRGKGVLEEPKPAKKMTRSDFDTAQVARDEEVARQLELELQAEVERERQKEEPTSMDYIANLFDEEKYTMDKRAKLLAEFFEMRKKQLAEKRDVAIRKQPSNKNSTEKRRRFLKNSDKGMDNTKKRKKGSRMKRMSKRQKTGIDLEEEEQLKAFLSIVPDEEGEVNYEVLEKRVDGSLRYIKTFTEMVSRFDRGLWFEENPERLIFRSIKRNGFLDITERKYPLTKETLERMISLRLVDGTASEDAYTLLRFIQKQIDEYGSHDGGLASPKQMALGKDILNPLIVNSLLKTIWLSMHHVIAMKHWLFQSKRLEIGLKGITTKRFCISKTSNSYSSVVMPIPRGDKGPSAPFLFTKYRYVQPPVGSEAITYNLDQTSRYSANYTHMTANKIDVIDMACEEYSQEVLGFTDIIASGNHPVSPEFCTHKILMEEDYAPAVQHQRRVNPKIHDVIKKEVEKLLEAGLIYPISDSPWVSQFTLCTMKGGTVVARFKMYVSNLHDKVEDRRWKSLWTTSQSLGIHSKQKKKCLSRLGPHASRCEDTYLSINWKWSHFYGQRGHCPRP
ncbi:hypothetical protein Tco_0851626 [Tanacetum coccineum]